MAEGAGHHRALPGIDTRALTRRIREEGVPKRVIAHEPDGKFDIAGADEARAGLAGPGRHGSGAGRHAARKAMSWDRRAVAWAQGYRAASDVIRIARMSSPSISA